MGSAPKREEEEVSTYLFVCCSDSLWWTCVNSIDMNAYLISWID
jgi:hypothetical protein